MLQVLTAPIYEEEFNMPKIFLGGGIQKCWQWQKQVIENLKDLDAVVFNPRRKNFPIHDPNAAQEQITWEFKYLNDCDIFTMYFCGDTESDQPICMYELGRHLARFDNMDKLEDIVICVEHGYKREQDVYVQTGLVNENITIVDNMKDYCIAIRQKVEDLNTRRLEQIFY